MQDVTSCIYNVPIFKQLPRESVVQLQRVMVHRTLEAGETWARAGDVIEHLVVVHVGRLRLSRVATGGREQVLRELGPGEFYGEIGLFADVIGEGDLVAVQDTEACVLDRDAVHNVLRESPHMTFPLVRTLARRLFEAERTVGELALYDVGQRLTAELLRQAAAAAGLHAPGADVRLEGEASFELPFSWAQLATKLGTTPESLSRRLSALSGSELIRVQGRRVVIADVDALRDTLFASD